MWLWLPFTYSERFSWESTSLSLIRYPQAWGGKWRPLFGFFAQNINWGAATSKRRWMTGSQQVGPVSSLFTTNRLAPSTLYHQQVDPVNSLFTTNRLAPSTLCLPPTGWPRQLSVYLLPRQLSVYLLPRPSLCLPFAPSRSPFTLNKLPPSTLFTSSKFAPSRSLLIL